MKRVGMRCMSSENRRTGTEDHILAMGMACTRAGREPDGGIDLLFDLHHMCGILRHLLTIYVDTRWEHLHGVKFNSKLAEGG